LVHTLPVLSKQLAITTPGCVKNNSMQQAKGATATLARRRLNISMISFFPILKKAGKGILQHLGESSSPVQLILIPDDVQEHQ